MALRALSDSLSLRLIVLLTIALLPLGFIALFQTYSIMRDSEELSRAALLAETERAAASERELLRNAQGAVEGLSAAMPALASDTGACSAALERLVESQDAFIFAGFIPVSGKMQCSTTGKPVDFTSHDSFKASLEDPQPRLTINRKGAVTGRAVVIASTPVYHNDSLIGFLSVSIPHELTQTAVNKTLQARGIQLATIDRAGKVLTSTTTVETAREVLPDNINTLRFAERTGNTLIATSRSGERRLFAVSEVIEGQVLLVGSWPLKLAQSSDDLTVSFLSLVFPILMWIAGISVAFLGLHSQVIRHIRAIRRAMRQFALGRRRREQLQLDDPSREFKELQTAFNRMVMILSEAEKQREEDLHEKTVLLREVHHRVKNNLQLIASIMNMHGRTAQTPEARRLLAQLQRRVQGLATVHRTINSSDEMANVDLSLMIRQLVEELGPTVPVDGKDVEVELDVDRVTLGQDQAVTLSILAAEILVNAVKNVGSVDGGTPKIRIALKALDDNLLRFAVSNTWGETADDAEDVMTSDGVGRRLMRAFASQLEANVEVHDDNQEYTYQIEFPIAAFDPDPPAQFPRHPATRSNVQSS